MTYDQAQSPRLGQRVPVESTYVRMFSGDEIPEAAWPGQIIYRNEEQILQVYNGESWENVTGGVAGQLTFVGTTPPLAQHVGDIWFNSADDNRMYVAHSVGADAIVPGEWELVSAQTPGLTATTHIYHQSTPPGALDIPPPTDNDFWFETPDNKQYYYLSTAPGTHWVAVRDGGIAQAIISTVVEYAVSSSETVAPTTGWSTTTPVRTPGTFIWTRTTITKGDGSVTTTSPALLTGNTGLPGDPGIPGVPGPPGSNGQALYTWIKYADTPTSGMSDSPGGKVYMGIAYNKTTPVESSVYADYEWSSTQGPLGSQGVPGPPGADGTPMYTWIKYATSAAGAGMNDSPVGMSYLGIAYNKPTATESNTPGDYAWSLIVGPQGPQGSQGIQGPSGPNGQTLYTWIKYADTPTTGMSDFPAGKAYLGIAYNKTTAVESSTYSDYEWSSTLGPTGSQGVQGPPGANGQPTYTWIKYGTSAAGAGITDDPAGMTYMGIAYNKTTATESVTPGDYSWSLIQGPPGPTGANAATITLTSTTQVLVVAAGGTITPATATVTGVPVNTTITTWTYSVDSGAFSGTLPAGVSRNVNVVTITGSTMTAKTIAIKADNGAGVADTLTVAKVTDGATGTPGTPGTAGRGITATTVTYQVHTNGTTAPTGTWLSTPQATTTGQFLWTRTVTDYSSAPTPVTSYSVSAHGSTGSTGTAGVGISGTVVTYQVHTNGTTAPTGTWLATPQATTTGQFLWTRTVTTMTDASVSTGYSVSAHGATGAAGADAYTVLLSNENQTFAAGTTNALAATATSTVIAFKGTVAQTAAVGTITGGVTGISAAVTNNNSTAPLITITVTTALVTPNGTLTVPITIAGITFTQNFTWSLSYTGVTGAPAAMISLSATTQVLTQPATGGATTPATAVVTGTAVNTIISLIEYSVNGAAFSTSLPTGATVAGNVVTITGANMPVGTRTIAVKMSGGGTSDTTTVARSVDGAVGGVGADAYTILLTNESHTFPGTTTGAVGGTTTTQVIAYKGATLMTSHVNAITGATGISAATTTNDSTASVVTITVTTALATGGTLSIPIVVDGKTFTKQFTYTVSLTGATGVSVLSLTPFFALVTPIGGAAPAQPSNTLAIPPDPPWKTVEPAWVDNTELYRTERTSYSNATYSYSLVTKVSTYAGISVKTRTYYATGSIPNPSYLDPTLLPTDPAYQPPTLWVPLAGTFVTGDVWYQTDDNNRMFRWSGTAWIDVSDLNIPTIIESGRVYGEDIDELDQTVKELAFTATSADNTADTADGRVSMSDYKPGYDDLFYPVLKIDPVTELPVEVLVPRVNGSIWFTRTRPRKNWCTNPSLETNQTGWTGSQATILREVAAFVPAGIYTLKVTNSVSTTLVHYAQWTGTPRTTCSEGQVWTASAYAELLTGASPGTYMSILWHNAAGAVISTSTGDPMDLTLNAFGSLLGTAYEPRLKVTATAPALAVSFYVRINSPALNANAVWHTGALLVEQEDDLGRYFDGDSLDGKWDGTVHATTSVLNGDKIYDLWELRDGDWIQKFLTSSTINDLDASKLYGEVNGDIIQDATLGPEKLATVLVPASEALAAGDLVNIWSEDGDARARKASAALCFEAHGYVLEAVVSGSNAIVRHNGYNTLLTGLTPGDQWLSATAGKSASSPPKTPGTMLQRVGHAPDDQVLNFAPADPIWIV